MWSEKLVRAVRAAPACVAAARIGPSLAAPDDERALGARTYASAQPSDLGHVLLRGQVGPDVIHRLTGHQSPSESLLLVIMFALDHRLLVYFFLTINNCRELER